jgi:predicted DNA binding CopG/RHH family protein
MEDNDGGLFNIEISSDDEAENESEKVPRDFQSEEDFQQQRAEWKPKIEVGEVKITSPLFYYAFLSGTGS